MKKCTRKKGWNLFLEAFFSHLRKLFSKFPYKIFVNALHEINGLQNFSLSFCKSKSRITMCNLHWCYTFCTGVTLFALVLHLNCTALSQSESSNFFMCIIKALNGTHVNLFCHDTGSIQGWSIFLVCFSTYLKTKTSMTMKTCC